MRVLYIEDVLSHIRLMQRIVEGLGHDLLIAVDGRQAVIMAGLLNPGLLFVDLCLPDLDGLSVAFRIEGFSVSAGGEAPVSTAVETVVGITALAGALESVR